MLLIMHNPIENCFIVNNNSFTNEKAGENLKSEYWIRYKFIDLLMLTHLHQPARIAKFPMKFWNEQHYRAEYHIFHKKSCVCMIQNNYCNQFTALFEIIGNMEKFSLVVFVVAIFPNVESTEKALQIIRNLVQWYHNATGGNN